MLPRILGGAGHRICAREGTTRRTMGLQRACQVSGTVRAFSYYLIYAGFLTPTLWKRGKSQKLVNNLHMTTAIRKERGSPSHSLPLYT